MVNLLPVCIITIGGIPLQIFVGYSSLCLRNSLPYLILVGLMIIDLRGPQSSFNYCLSRDIFLKSGQCIVFFEDLFVPWGIGYAAYRYSRRDLILV